VALELGVRLSWDNMPDAVYPNDTGCCGGYTLRKNVDGHDLFHRFHHNSLGYRGPEYAPRPQGKLRVAVVGDSFVYGVAVSGADAIPGRLEARLLDRGLEAEVVNAGMPGNNLEYDLARVRGTVRDYHPDIVSLVLLYNDFEEAKSQLGRGGGFDSARVKPTGERNRMGDLAEWMLPRVDAGDPRFGPRATQPAPYEWRYGLARWWRTYMFLGLNFRKLGTDWGLAEREFTLLHVDSRQVEAVAWSRLRDTLAEVVALGKTEGFRLVVSIFMDGPIEGIPALKLREAITASGAAHIDLAPLWGDLSNYNREFSFRFDNHPNRRANDMAAEVIEHGLGALGWLPGSPLPDDSAFMAQHQQAEASYLARQETIAAEQRAQLDAWREGFSAWLAGEERDDQLRRRQANQWLFGWVDPTLDMRVRGKLLSAEGGFFLRAAEVSASLRVQGTRLAAGGIELRAECDGVATSPPQSELPAEFDIALALARPVRPGEVVECVLRVEGRGPTSPHGSQAQVAISRLELAAAIP